MDRRRRIMLVFGTRPEAVKMAPVYHALLAEPDRFEVLCCVTAQHRSMLDQVLQAFGIVPDIDLDLMRPGQDITELSAAVQVAMRAVLAAHRPDLVLVHGDTTTTMATALAAFHGGIALGHVEAGLRSHDMSAPFPEELNRRVTSLAASYHFAPTQANRENLLREGCDPATIFVTGNTVVDALHDIAARLDGNPELARKVERDIAGALDFDWRAEDFVLVTCHRREAFGAGIEAMCSAIAELADSFPDVGFVLPVHPNPHVSEAVAARLAGHPRIYLTPPLPYEAFVALLRECRLVLTDSGGVQEEAPSFGKPVLVMRDVTERTEAVAAGCARLVNTDAAGIVAATGELLRDPTTYDAMVASTNPYGDGRAALRIVEALRDA